MNENEKQQKINQLEKMNKKIFVLQIDYENAIIERNVFLKAFWSKESTFKCMSIDQLHKLLYK